MFYLKLVLKNNKEAGFKILHFERCEMPLYSFFILFNKNCLWVVAACCRGDAFLLVGKGKLVRGNEMTDGAKNRTIVDGKAVKDTQKGSSSSRHRP